MATVADHVIATLQRSGVRRVYGIPGDSLNGFTDAIRRAGDFGWEQVRHEETAAFAAAASVRVTPVAPTVVSVISRAPQSSAVRPYIPGLGSAYVPAQEPAKPFHRRRCADTGVRR